MSPLVSGPALFFGSLTAYVMLERPKLDPTDPGLRRAAERAGVTPEEFAGPGDVWALTWEDEDGEGGGFELPGLRDAEAEDFAERLRLALGTGEPFTIEAGCRAAPRRPPGRLPRAARSPPTSPRPRARTSSWSP